MLRRPITRIDATDGAPSTDHTHSIPTPDSLTVSDTDGNLILHANRDLLPDTDHVRG